MQATSNAEEFESDPVGPIGIESEILNVKLQARTFMMLRTSFRAFSTGARQTLKIGLIPADGIGKEVIPVSLIHNFLTV